MRLRIQARLHDGVVPVPFLGTTWQQRGRPTGGRRTGAVVLLIALTVFVGASAVAATSMHWIDLSIGLPRLHASIHPGGSLAVFRNIFGDAGVDTEFRDRVRQIVARRENDDVSGPPPELRPTMRELAAEGLFLPMRTERWKWAIELTTPQVTRLFRTFSNWTEQEVHDVAAAAEACGGRVTERYQSVLHLLRRA